VMRQALARYLTNSGGSAPMAYDLTQFALRTPTPSRRTRSSRRSSRRTRWMLTSWRSRRYGRWTEFLATSNLKNPWWVSDRDGDGQVGCAWSGGVGFILRGADLDQVVCENTLPAPCSWPRRCR